MNTHNEDNQHKSQSQKARYIDNLIQNQVIFRGTMWQRC